jgi:proline dehydrogenase
MVDFSNTKIAFEARSTAELKRAKLLFVTVSKGWLVWLGDKLVTFALWLRIPIGWAVKPTIFKHFVGGETLDECSSVAQKLYESGVFSILDYSVEGESSNAERHRTHTEILRTISFAANKPYVPFAVFKPSGLVDVAILERIQSGEVLIPHELEEYNLFTEKLDSICRSAHEHNIPILVDAEETWYQNPIDVKVTELMAKYNRQSAIVFNTLQMYRHDRLDFLKKVHKAAIANGYILGIKLVRGAYMEKERERAMALGIPSPINPTKADTDHLFDSAVEYCIDNIDTISLFAGSHNEGSNAKLAALIHSKNIKANDSRIFFSQLYGMSDHISFNLAKEGYNVAKYVPFGSVQEVMPYLIRRARENTSVKGQTGRELKLINEELLRRKQDAK